MDTIKRFEHRFVSNTENYELLRNRLQMLPQLELEDFSKKVTQTIYYHSSGEVVDNGEDYYVRVRNYIAEKTPNIKIMSSQAFLEIKTRGQEYVRKDRVPIDAYNITQMLANEIPRNELIPKWLPILHPVGATQSYRLHWSFQDNIRITLDDDIEFFRFMPGSLNASRFGNLRKSKIEFKFNSHAEQIASEILEKLFYKVQYERVTNIDMEMKARARYSWKIAT